MHFRAAADLQNNVVYLTKCSYTFVNALFG